MSKKIQKSDEEWRKELTPEQYAVTRKGSTERAFSGDLYELKADGMYKCVCCGADLFSSETKYDSGSGWPSFYAPAQDDNVGEHQDRSFGMVRTEVTCQQCSAHLGHLFPDGPQPTGMRYCINSAALKFEKKNEKK